MTTKSIRLWGRLSICAPVGYRRNWPVSNHQPGPRFQPLVTLVLLGLLVTAPAWGQAYTPSTWGTVFTMTREQLIKYTAKNPYERFPDGRPKVPDALLEKFQEQRLGPKAYEEYLKRQAAQAPARP
jgi:hypothetical protein